MVPLLQSAHGLAIWVGRIERLNQKGIMHHLVALLRHNSAENSGDGQLI